MKRGYRSRKRSTEIRAPAITNSNRAYFAKMLGRGFQVRAFIFTRSRRSKCQYETFTKCDDDTVSDVDGYGLKAIIKRHIQQFANHNGFGGVFHSVKRLPVAEDFFQKEKDR